MDGSGNLRSLTVSEDLGVCDPFTSFRCFVRKGYQNEETLRHREGITFLADLLPEDETEKQRQWHQKVVDRMERYWKYHDGYVTYEDHALTYGEVTPLGTRQLARAMGFSPLGHGEDMSNAIFVDLGSGVGRLVTQIHLEYPILRAIGVELSKERHDIGIQALQGIWGELQLEPYFWNDDFNPTAAAATVSSPLQPSASSLSSLVPPSPIVPMPSSIELIQDDGIHFLQVTNIPMSHVYMSSLCFPQPVLEQIQQLLLRIPSVQVVAALNRLDAFV